MINNSVPFYFGLYVPIGSNAMTDLLMARGSWWCLMFAEISEASKMLYCSGQTLSAQGREASNKIQQTLLCLRACSNMLSSFIFIFLYVSSSIFIVFIIIYVHFFAFVIIHVHLFAFFIIYVRDIHLAWLIFINYISLSYVMFMYLQLP